MDKEKILAVIREQIMLLGLPNITEKDIQLGIKMTDLGANSIDRAEVVIGSMKALQIKVPLASLGQVKDITGLVEIFHNTLNNHA